MCLATIDAEPSRSATVRATFGMWSCARAERLIRRIAISSVLSPVSSSAHCLRIIRVGIRELLYPRVCWISRARPLAHVFGRLGQLPGTELPERDCGHL